MAMPDILGLLGTKRTKPEPAKEPDSTAAVTESQYSDEELLDLWKDVKKEAFEHRHIFLRQWQRNILYTLNRMWIEYFPRSGAWKDKRMASWIPRPVTPKCKETVQTIRSMFTSIKLAVNVRPNGGDPINVSAAATADDLAPLLYEAHDMDHVLNEFDFWLIVTGNAFMHSFVDYDIKHGMLTITAEQCMGCGKTYPSTELTGAQPICPECGGDKFQQAIDPLTGVPMQTTQPKGAPTTIALSPLEVAFPNSYVRFSDLPYIVRLRWRTKRYYEAHPVLSKLVESIVWQKSADDQSLQMFRSLASHNDLGLASSYWDGLQSESQEEGIAEYEVWMRPTEKYPEGLVFRVVGDGDPQVLHLEDTEALPGPLPYQDASGNPLFTFAHAGYDHVGGRILASGALDQIIQKQDQLNQLDSMIQLIIQRMSNPVWLEPKGAEIEKLTGMPGLVIKWNPLMVGGNAKPERIPGEGPPDALFKIREQYLRDIEELAGTYDIMKGAKPAGVEAFSAMQLLVERSQARFANVFQARGNAFKDVALFQLELEREFGPDERTKAILSPARTWTFQNFKRAQLSGSFSVVVEDGSAVPKTSLGMRAAVQQATSLGMMNMLDPDQQYEGLKLFGLTKMVPTLDIHVQAALQKQQAFESWIADPSQIQASMAKMQQQGQQFAAQQATIPPDPTGLTPAPVPPSPLQATPLKWYPWYKPAIHRQEFLKWANSDRIREMLADPQRGPVAEPLLIEHLQEIDNAMTQEAMAMAPAPPPQGSGMAMMNSNRESTTGIEPGSAGQPATT